MEKLSNPQKTIEIIKKYEFAFQKKFGQNFLIDSHVLDKIIAAAGITKEDCGGDRAWDRYFDAVPGGGGQRSGGGGNRPDADPHS